MNSECIKCSRFVHVSRAFSLHSVYSYLIPIIYDCLADWGGRNAVAQRYFTLYLDLLGEMHHPTSEFGKVAAARRLLPH